MLLFRQLEKEISVILSDTEIRKAIDSGQFQIYPMPDDECIQPASIDLRLNDRIKLYQINETYLRLGQNVRMDEFIFQEFTLSPGQFALVSTAETIRLSEKLVGRIEGKSSIGRLGLAVHITAGFIDPGFRGQITLEIKNVNSMPIKIQNGMKICQLCLMRVDGEVKRPYGMEEIGSKYQNQIGPTEPR